MLQVWSEPSVVDAAAWEFAETAAFLDAGKCRTDAIYLLSAAAKVST